MTDRDAAEALVREVRAFMSEGGRPGGIEAKELCDALEAALKREGELPTEGAALIVAERRRQIEQEGWTPEHDDEHDGGQMALAACCYAAPIKLYEHDDRHVQLIRFVDPWPWAHHWDKRFRYGEHRENPGNILPDPETYGDEERIDLLVKAGALIAAEVDRLLRARRHEHTWTQIAGGAMRCTTCGEVLDVNEWLESPEGKAARVKSAIRPPHAEPEHD